jgi:hypothetical protein
VLVSPLEIAQFASSSWHSLPRQRLRVGSSASSS